MRVSLEAVLSIVDDLMHESVAQAVEEYRLLEDLDVFDLMFLNLIWLAPLPW